MHHSPSRSFDDAFALTSFEAPVADLERIGRLMVEELGYKDEAMPTDLVRNRLGRRARSLGMDLASYAHYVAQGHGYASEKRSLIDALTTNTTAFFREPRHFELLGGPMVRSLLARRAESRPLLKLWSAASSDGSEAYTIAMTMAQASERHGFRYAVLGTDVSDRVLASARTAIYAGEAGLAIPRRLRDRYVLSATRADDDRIRVAPEIRRRVGFQRMNLMASAYPVDRDVDVIFLRNVLIYLEADARIDVVRRLYDHLRPGGYLVLGHSEASVGLQAGLDQIETGVFAKSS